jgi:hypothetical protein
VATAGGRPTPESAPAAGISDGGVIVGTGEFNRAVHAFAMVPVPEPGAFGLALAAAAGGLAARRKGRLVISGA